jgi:RNA polymerase sigma factor (sigma-70 family)
MSETAQAAGAPAQSEQLDFAESSEAELFEWMATAASCAADAQAAFTEFHRRHAGFLYRQCERHYPDAAEDIVADTLRLVYKNADKFDLNRVREPVTPELARRRVRSWLCRIAHNVASDYFAAMQREPQTVTPERITTLPDVTCADPAKDAPALNAGLIDKVRQVVNELPEREREIAWVIAHRWSPDHEQNQWSSEDLDVIAEQFGLTRENIRQIRSRLIKKLRTLLTPILGGSGSAR